MTVQLGDWVTREFRGVSHLVESVVANDAVTRCGRRLRDEPTKTGGKLVPYALRPYCKVCQGPAT